MHEFVVSLEKLKKETGATALDVAKAMLDCGIHPPTMYFPLIVHEALMFEPTETESKETLDDAADAMQDTVLEAWKNLPKLVKTEYFTTWLTRILLYNSYDILRKRRREAPAQTLREEGAEQDVYKRQHYARARQDPQLPES